MDSGILLMTFDAMFSFFNYFSYPSFYDKYLILFYWNVNSRNETISKTSSGKVTNSFLSSLSTLRCCSLPMRVLISLILFALKSSTWILGRHSTKSSLIYRILLLDKFNLTILWKRCSIIGPDFSTNLSAPAPKIFYKSRCLSFEADIKESPELSRSSLAAKSVLALIYCSF